MSAQNIRTSTSQAACKNLPLRVFFPEEGPGKEPYGRARLYCNSCTLKKPCAEYAMTNNIKYGMWGGLTPRDRRRAYDPDYVDKKQQQMDRLIHECDG